jgi:beta-carotene hydroxylase
MSDRNVSFDRLTPAERTRFKTLTSAPPLGWLTLALWVLLNAAFLCSDTLGVTGRIPLWVGMLVNSLVGYVAFSVVHDSIHRAVSAHTKLNDWIGQLARKKELSIQHNFSIQPTRYPAAPAAVRT